MTDPWDRAAQEIIERRAREASEHEALVQQRMTEDAARQAEAEAAHREMQSAIAEALPGFIEFLEKRGAAAQRLLAALSGDAFILFGGEREGGGYYSVYLSGDGLVFERGTGGDYGTTPTHRYITTPQEALKAFARDGEGYGNPQRVRDIVPWLTKRLDDIAHR